MKQQYILCAISNTDEDNDTECNSQHIYRMITMIQNTTVKNSLFVIIYSVMMLTTSITTTSWMLPMLANTTMAVADVTTRLPCLLIFGRLKQRKNFINPE